MFYVYVLRNTITNRYYIGATGNLIRRLEEHNRGQTRSTKRIGNWLLVYKEEYKSILEAKKREKVIKSYKGGNAFRKLIVRA